MAQEQISTIIPIEEPIIVNKYQHYITINKTQLTYKQYLRIKELSVGDRINVQTH
jgi:hypothetical protein